MNRAHPDLSLVRPAISVAGAILCCAAAVTAYGEARPAAPTAKSFLGDRAVRIIEGATKVEVFRIKPMQEQKPAGEVIGGYTVLSAGRDQGPDFARRLAAVLLDDKTYDFDRAKGCIFSPGVVFRFRNGAELVEVITCYHCSEFKIVVKDARGAVVRVVGEDFDNARPALVKLAKDAFPDDKEIQALNDRG